MRHNYLFFASLDAPNDGSKPRDLRRPTDEPVGDFGSDVTAAKHVAYGVHEQLEVKPQ